MSVLIRKITPQDASVLADLHAISFPENPWSEQQMQSSLALDSTVGFLAQTDNRVTGFILFQQMGDEAEVLTFAVDPSYRRRGLGAQLLLCGLKSLPFLGAVFLEVAEDNASARALYEKEGFRINGLRPNYYKRAHGTVSAVAYRWDQDTSSPKR